MSDNLESRVVHFFLHAGKQNKSTTRQHFKMEGISREKVNRIVKNYEETGSGEKKTIPGRPPKKSTPKVLEDIKNSIRENPNLSTREGARTFKMSKSHFHRLNKEKLHNKTYCKTTIPKHSDKQKNAAKKNSRKIYREKTKRKFLSSMTKRAC